ncbi:chitinase, partial [Streptomyces sp. NPDC059340]
STAANLARRTVSEGYGVYLTYNLDGADRSADISAFTRELYGSDAHYTP